MSRQMHQDGPLLAAYLVHRARNHKQDDEYGAEPLPTPHAMRGTTPYTSVTHAR